MRAEDEIYFELRQIEIRLNLRREEKERKQSVLGGELT